MDVPFHSSGALSRSHYTLVRNVENAQTLQVADQLLSNEVDKIRDRFTRKPPTSSECKEALVLIMYCVTAISAPGVINSDRLEFALPYALNLAEAGGSLGDRRIGYLFCAEQLPATHDLHLMLVNTLLKDLSSSMIPRICTALEVIIASPSDVVVPAVRDRLYELLGHTSPLVRRRTVHALRALSKFDDDLLSRVPVRIKSLLNIKHPEPSVVYAVLDAMVDIVKLNTADADNLRGTLAALLRVSFREADKRWLARRALRAACLLKQSPPDPSALLALIHQLKVPKHGLPHCLLLEAYRALHLYPPEALSMVAKDLSPLSPIRPLLTSHDANAQYLFLDCLECLDLGLWAGNGSDESGNSALEPWEMERIMACLDSPDSLIRKKTLGILYRVDRSLVSGYFAQRLSSPRQQDADLNARATGLLELAAILGADDGHAYAQYVIQILEALDDADDVPARHEPENSKGKGQAIVKPQHGPVLEHAVEAVLLKIRDGDSPYQRSSVGALLATLGARDGADPSPTLMVILAALACEYAAAGVQDPREALSGFSIKLDSYRPAVQDACLLAMMRLVLECGDAGPTEDAITAVRTLTVGSGKHIRRRCTQFLDLTSKPEELRKVVKRMRTSSLPDFAYGLEASAPAEGSTSPKHTEGSLSPLSKPRAPDSPRSVTAKLRYAAYDAPPALAHGQLRRDHSFVPASASSRPTSSMSHRSVSRTSPRVTAQVGTSPRLSAREEMSPRMFATLSLSPRQTTQDVPRTVSPGELALAAGDYELEALAKSPPRGRAPFPVEINTYEADDTRSRPDLIALDSPFLSESELPDPSSPTPAGNAEEAEPRRRFEIAWNAANVVNTRGWCDVGIEEVVRRIQRLESIGVVVISANQAPFAGEVKLLVSSADSSAVLRLKESDEEGCLWRMRCGDAELRAKLKNALE